MLIAQPAASLARDQNASRHLRLAPLLFGLIASQKFVLGGEVFVGEILLIVYLIKNCDRLQITRDMRVMICLAVLWALSQVVSDIFNQSDLLDAAKGVLTPLVFIATLIGLVSYFSGKPQRLPSFLLGAQLGLLIQFVLVPGTYFAENPWKWGVGAVVVEAFAIYFTFFRSRASTLILVLFLACVAFIGLMNNGRSVALFPIIGAALYLWMRAPQRARRLERFRRKWGVSGIAVSLILFSCVLDFAASAVFSSELLLSRVPTESAEKFRSQANGRYGMVLGGRTEIFASMQAFFDSPILGHGSWARDTGEYRWLQFDSANQLGYSDKQEFVALDEYIPVHSYLMSALVWGGVLAGLFWIFMMRWLIVVVTTTNRLGFYFYNGAVALMWNILFSPFGAHARWAAAIYVAALLAADLIARHRPAASSQV